MARRRHPKPEVEEALRFAELSQWTVEPTGPRGHRWGVARCRERTRDAAWSASGRRPGYHGTTPTPYAARCGGASTDRSRVVNTFTFRLIVERPDLQDDRTLDALYEAGFDDATFGVENGVQYIEFARAAGSYGTALFSAMAQLRDVVPDVVIIDVDRSEYVTMSEIARRMGRSRESIRQLVQGLRGSGDFPSPARRVGSRSEMWLWPEVLSWFAERGEFPEDDRVRDGLPA